MWQEKSGGGGHYRAQRGTAWGAWGWSYRPLLGLSLSETEAIESFEVTSQI